MGHKELGEIVTRYSAGETMQQIADELNRNVKTVRRHLHAAGVQLRRPGIPKGTKRCAHPGIAVLVDLYTAQKLSTRECAGVLSVNASTIRAWLKDAGIPTRSISEAKKGQKPAPQTIEASVRSRRKNVIEGKPTVGYKLRADGYVSILAHGHPFSGKSGYVLEHRLVMEQKLGRYLLPKEDVHHLNDDRGDNRIENLELFASRSDHLKSHDKLRGRDALGRFPSKT